MTKRREMVLAILILLLAAALRLTGLDWDSYNHYHPDERYITWVATSIEWPQNWNQALDPRQSTFNPFYWPEGAKSEGLALAQAEQRRFAYGHLPLYLGVGITRLLENIGPFLSPFLPEEWLLTRDLLNARGWIEFRHLTVAGRFLTALVEIASVGLIYLLGRKIYRPVVGLLAAAFLALNVMHIQLGHFFTVDPFLTFFVLMSIMFMVGATRAEKNSTERSVYTLLAAVCIGLAVGSKFTGILLFMPLALTIYLDWTRSLQRRGLAFLAAGAVAFLTFALTNPFALLDLTCKVHTPSIGLGFVEVPSFNLGSCYLGNLAQQGAMVRGVSDVPFVRQYAGTVPFLYYIEMQLRWGMGPLLGAVAVAGFAWAVVIAALKIRGLHPFNLRNYLDRVGKAEAVILTWTVPFFLFTGSLDVKFMRYLEPLTPFLMLYGAAMLMSITRVRWRRTAIALVLSVTLLYALGFVNLYSQPHPWIEASRWIYENVEPGASFLSEMWDDSLPDTIVENDVTRHSSQYDLEDVNWLTGTEAKDGADKLEENLNLLAETDYLVLASNRNYGVIPRLPERYPYSSQYYRLLFDGTLGFDVAYAGTRAPTLFGIHMIPDSFGWPGLQPPQEVADYLSNLPGLRLGRFDESFTVYDQPLVILFENKDRLSAREMGEFFLSPDVEQ